MPIFQYKCDKCSSVFEHLVLDGKDNDVTCVACGSKKFTRMFSSGFAVKAEDRDCDNCKTGGCSGCSKSSSDNFSNNFVS